MKAKFFFFLLICSFTKVAIAADHSFRPNHTLLSFSSLAAKNEDSRSILAHHEPKTPNTLFNPINGIPGNTVISDAYLDRANATLMQIARMADQSLLQADIGHIVAPLSSTGYMTSPVNGNIENALYQNSGNYTIGERLKEVINLKDLGASLKNKTGSQDIPLINKAFSSNFLGKKIEIPSGVWPNYQTIPKNVSNTDYVEVLGRLVMTPAFNITQFGLGFGVPYFGDGVTAMTHNPGDGSDIEFSRVDSHNIGTKTFRPMTTFSYINDTDKENGSMFASGHQTVNVNTVTTQKSSGYTNNFTSNLWSMGMNYWGAFDVNHWDHSMVYGTNWVWDNIQELYEGAPYLCPPDEENVCAARYLNEEDMGGIGPEKIESAYDPTNTYRHMFWLTTNHNINHDSSAGARWAPSTSYQKYRIVTAKDSIGREWMFRALPVGYRIGKGLDTGTSGSTEPSWVFHKNALIEDGNLQWKCIGLWQYDLGSIFAIGGDNDPAHGYRERIGTVLTEQNDYIYNAIIDMSKAQFEDGIVHVLARMQKDMYLDLTANGTSSGQNNHLLGYKSNDNALEYILSAKIGQHKEQTIPFSVTDTGVTNISSLKIGDDTNPITSGKNIVRLIHSDNQLQFFINKKDIEIILDNKSLGYLSITKKIGNDHSLWVDVPNSHHTPCTAGDEANDSKYHYVCVTKNSWERIAWDRNPW